MNAALQLPSCPRSPAPRSAGFSLIELMVALVAGMIVAGAVLAFTASSLQSNSQYIQSTRLVQELRNASDQVGRELRRAGFNQAFVDQLQQLAGSPVVSSFAPIFISGEGTASSCVVYAYDRSPFDDVTLAGTVDLTNGEVRAVRRVVVAVDGRNVGVIEVAESVAGDQPACDDATADYAAYPPVCEGVWCPLSDPRMVDVTAFRVDYVSQDVAVPASDLSTLRTRVRDLEVTVSGSPANDPDVVRSVETTIRVRADCLRTKADMDAGVCETAPVGI